MPSGALTDADIAAFLCFFIDNGLIDIGVATIWADHIIAKNDTWPDWVDDVSLGRDPYSAIFNLTRNSNKKIVRQLSLEFVKDQFKKDHIGPFDLIPCLEVLSLRGEYDGTVELDIMNPEINYLGTEITDKNALIYLYEYVYESLDTWAYVVHKAEKLNDIAEIIDDFFDKYIKDQSMLKKLPSCFDF